MKHNNKVIHHKGGSQQGGRERQWYESVYKGFLIASVWVFLFSFGFTGETQFSATITGYSLLIMSISLIIIVLLYNVAKNNQHLSVMGSIFNVFINGGPFIVMVFLMCVILSILITYRSEIIAGTVSSGYFSFSNISIMLFMTQIYIIYNAMESESFQTTGKLNRIVSGIAYLLDILEALCAIILFIILKYYKTDG